ncbi:hypothetical protein [Methylobacterium sp. Leaf88]|uniref:hypothetical protein n=1 Tax=Methylobacterium sp. Leaf88 TaxID=1736244 RepID=UPI0006F5484D|nr:hypothetical protein [Methylobacterium sp. Leaf88]KQO63338.1 hypothetical protein ASF20_08045 [Methylobacterium sp. Leaf88]
MKRATLLLVAISLFMAAHASAQSLQPPSDGPSTREAPRTKRERDLGLDGKPRGQRELSAPDRDGYSTEEPDDEEDDDLGEALRGAQPAEPQAR